jgi:hypothetical protein
MSLTFYRRGNKISLAIERHADSVIDLKVSAKRIVATYLACYLPRLMNINGQLNNSNYPLLRRGVAARRNTKKATCRTLLAYLLKPTARPEQILVIAHLSMRVSKV